MRTLTRGFYSFLGVLNTGREKFRWEVTEKRLDKFAHELSGQTYGTVREEVPRARLFWQHGHGLL